MFADILSRFWWMALLRGALWIVFGVVLYLQPAISIATLTLLFGLFVLADGIGNTVTAIGGRRQHDDWWVLLLTGLLGIGVGLLSLYNPMLTALALLFYIAIWAIATGMLQVVAAIRLRKEIQGEFWLILGGVASVTFGVLAMLNPVAGKLTVLWLIAGFAIVYGSVVILLALKARRFAGRVREAVKFGA
jgi:uncharacterized membrane protein HdeD (DUF308 family)